MQTYEFTQTTIDQTESPKDSVDLSFRTEHDIRWDSLTADDASAVRTAIKIAYLLSQTQGEAARRQHFEQLASNLAA